MAGGINQGGGDDELQENSDINVTPFIDVMLVLLIIFMVAAPLSTVDVPVNLPRSNAAAAPRPQEPVYVTLQPDLSISVGNETIQREALAGVLREAMAEDPQGRLYIRADETVPYGELMALMNLLRSGGFTQVGLVGQDAATAGPAPAEAPGAAAVPAGAQP